MKEVLYEILLMFDYFLMKGKERASFEEIEKSQNLLENEAVIMNYLKEPKIPYINEQASSSATT